MGVSFASGQSFVDSIIMEGAVSPLSPLFAISLSMIVFASLIILGAYILRRLHIDAEPPEVNRFQPPAPELIQGAPDSSRAQRQAESRRTLQPFYQQAEKAHLACLQIIDGLYTIEHGLNTSRDAIANADQSTVQNQVPVWRKQVDQLKSEIEERLPALYHDQSIQEKMADLHGRVMHLHGEVEALWLAQGHDKRPQGRLILLLVGLILVILWAVILFGV